MITQEQCQTMINYTIFLQNIFCYCHNVDESI